jgi:hypothetical protein
MRLDALASVDDLMRLMVEDGDDDHAEEDLLANRPLPRRRRFTWGSEPMDVDRL